MERDHWSFGIGYVSPLLVSVSLLPLPPLRAACPLPLCRFMRPRHPLAACTATLSAYIPVNAATDRRRVCPGVILAEKEVFLGLAHMLWAFKISPIPGVPIDLKEYDGVSGRSPVPFVVRLTPRDASVAEVLNSP